MRHGPSTGMGSAASGKQYKWGLIVAFMFFVAYTSVFGLKVEPVREPSLNTLDNSEARAEKVCV